MDTVIIRCLNVVIWRRDRVRGSCVTEISAAKDSRIYETMTSAAIDKEIVGMMGGLSWIS